MWHNMAVSEKVSILESSICTRVKAGLQWHKRRHAPWHSGIAVRGGGQRGEPGSPGPILIRAIP